MNKGECPDMFYAKFKYLRDVEQATFISHWLAAILAVTCMILFIVSFCCCANPACLLASLILNVIFAVFALLTAVLGVVTYHEYRKHFYMAYFALIWVGLLLAAGNVFPSIKNTQPWNILVMGTSRYHIYLLRTITIPSQDHFNFVLAEWKLLQSKYGWIKTNKIKWP